MIEDAVTDLATNESIVDPDAVVPQLEADARMPEAVLDEAMMAEMRDKVGVDLRIGHSINNREVTAMSVLKFAAGIGDTNPLWLDDDHAGASPYGAPVAPPSWVICCFAGIQFGWPGLGSFHSNSDVRFHLPVMVGDVLTPSCRYEGFSGPRASKFAEAHRDRSLPEPLHEPARRARGRDQMGRDQLRAPDGSGHEVRRGR